MKILVAEDDKKLASFLVKGFRETGFAVDLAENGLKAVELALLASYDAAVVDIMLPGMDGLAVVEEMRKKKKSTPVIFLSAKRSVDDRVLGLRKGGDDYLTKPFSFTELLARVQALIRRTGQPEEATELVLADLKVDLLSREVQRGEKKIELQSKEFALLEYLLKNSGRVLTKTMILEQLWNYQFDPQTNVVDVLICRLRNKMDKDFKNKLIHTIRGAGYVLKEH